ncbi:hypothetical protein SDC9_178375 [bioreactor metagenome]|uniref:Uncharacterized protein n=1 Tax=bioreactor metagenome TaxID=1076179 RepID=A0A645H3L2_9ZZZZ
MRSSAGTASRTTSVPSTFAVPTTDNATGAGVEMRSVLMLSRATACVPLRLVGEALKPFGASFRLSLIRPAKPSFRMTCTLTVALDLPRSARLEGTILKAKSGLGALTRRRYPYSLPPLRPVSPRWTKYSPSRGNWRRT